MKILNKSSFFYLLMNVGVESSLHAGMLLPETNFEVQGDESWGHHSGPFRARTWKMSKPLLSDYSVILYGKSSILSEGTCQFHTISYFFLRNMFDSHAGMLQLCKVVHICKNFLSLQRYLLNIIVFTCKMATTLLYTC